MGLPEEPRGTSGLDPRSAERAASEDTWRSFRMLVEAVEDYAIFGLDHTGRVTSWNAGAEKIKGYSADEILGQHYSVFYPRDDVEAGKPERQLEVAAREGRLEAEGWRVRKDGTRFWAHVVITALRDESQRLVGFAKVTRDITERRAADDARRKASRELATANAVLRRQAAELIRAADRANTAAQRAEAASRAKSAFLATMSHELRTPLNGLVGMTELLLGTPLDAEQSECAHTIESCAQSLLAVVSDVLDYAQVEVGQQEMRMADVEIGAVLAESARLLGVSARRKGLELLVDVETGTPTIVRGDPSRVRQVVLNLVGNAIKFTHQGRIVMRVRRDSAAAVARVEVADTGIGIEPADRSRLFAPFSQLDSSSTRAYGGSGLGLAISKQLVELMAGQIGVDSVPARGSTFWFSLPLADTTLAPGSSRHATRRTSHESRSGSAPRHPSRTS